MALSFDELRSKRKPRTETVRVPLDEDLLGRIADIEERLPVEQHLDRTQNRPPRVPRLRQELEDLKAEAAEAAETFVFTELPTPDYRDLRDSCPSDDPGLRWDEDTFAPAIMHATCTSHDFTLEQWQTLWAEWGAWIILPMFHAAYSVNEGKPRVPFGETGSDETTSSEPSSPTADPEDSPTPSS